MMNQTAITPSTSTVLPVVSPESDPGLATSKFLPRGALARLVTEVRCLPGLSSLTAAVEDQSKSTLGDVFWGVRKFIINLGALAMASHLKHLGLARVHAYYPVMRGKEVETHHDLIGLSCNEVSIAACMERVRELRGRMDPQPLVIVGGPGMETWWRKLLEAGADGVILGDGQYPLTQLLGVVVPLMENKARTLREAFHQARKAGKLTAVGDLAFVDGGGVMTRNTPQGLVRDLDEYVISDYGLIQGYARKHLKCIHHSSGCVFRCAFCSSIVNQRFCYRHVSVERLLDELDQAQREGYHEVFLSSDLFLAGDARHNRLVLEQLARGKTERGITLRISSQTTVASLHDLVCRNAGTEAEPRWEENPEGIKLLNDVGAYRWTLGVEAFSQEECARLGKDPRQKGGNAARTLTALCRHGMTVHAMMMVHEDTPYERAVEIGHILGDVGVGSAQFFYPVPAPNTPWGASAFKEGGTVLGRVGTEVAGASRCTGEYPVAAKDPQRAVMVVETCYNSFLGPRNILQSIFRGNFFFALMKLGLLGLTLARRYVSPQHYLYLAAILRGDYTRWQPGDPVWEGQPLHKMSGPKLDMGLRALLRQHERSLRAGDLAAPVEERAVMPAPQPSADN
jgi:radical SAM superfamily enzyme YgiQ (UPF0313 family)